MQERTSQESSPPRNPQNPKSLGLSIITHLKGIGIPDSQGICDQQRLQTYASLFQDLAELEEGLKLCDHARGEVYWLRGSILNLCKPIRKGQKGILAHGEWTQFLKRANVSASTSENLRHVQVRFSREEARQLGYCGMLAKLAGEKQSQRPPAPRFTPSTDVDASRSGDEVEPSDAPDQGDGAADEQSASLETANLQLVSADDQASQDAGSTDGSGNGAPQLRLTAVPARFDRILDSLEFMASKLPEAVDLLANPETTKAVLDTYEGKIAAVRNGCNAFATGIAKARARVDEYIADGQFVELKRREADLLAPPDSPPDQPVGGDAPHSTPQSSPSMEVA